jgi:hypothetical protein
VKHLGADSRDESTGAITSDSQWLAKSIPRDGPAGDCPMLGVQFPRLGEQIIGSIGVRTRVRTPQNRSSCLGLRSWSSV